ALETDDKQTVSSETRPNISIQATKAKTVELEAGKEELFVLE
ncbi:12420_t:CDS:1, partial [Racocetra fulgida]